MAAEAAANKGGTKAGQDVRLLEEQQAYDRVALEAEKLERTREKVNEMWQSLE